MLYPSVPTAVLNSPRLLSGNCEHFWADVIFIFAPIAIKFWAFPTGKASGWDNFGHLGGWFIEIEKNHQKGRCVVQPVYQDGNPEIPAASQIKKSIQQPDDTKKYDT